MKITYHSYLIILITVIIYGTAYSYASLSTDKENNALLLQLDSIIANHQNLVNEKEIRINGLRETLSKAKTNNERIGITRQLYDEYLVFDSDSALRYATETRKLIERSPSQDYDQLTQWKLNEAFIYTVQGLFDTTMELLHGIDSSKLSDEMKSKYFESIAYIYSMRSVYLNTNQEMSRKDTEIANQYRDSIQSMNLPATKEYLWVPIAVGIERGGAEFAEIDIVPLKRKVDASTGASRENAINSACTIL